METVALRQWQQNALDVWGKTRHGVVAVVTGGGKTKFALACANLFLSESGVARVNIVVPSVALLDQWQIVLVDEFSAKEHEISVFGGGKASPSANKFNLMVINTARREAARLADGARTLLIVDECHRIASEENSRALAGHHNATLGLSATPERDFDQLFQDVVVPVLGPIIYRYDYTQALEDGVITPFNLTNVRVSMTDKESRDYESVTRRIAILARTKLSNGVGDAEERMKRLLRERARIGNNAVMRVPATIRIMDSHKRVRSLIFHEQIAAADVITYELNKRGHRAVPYHSGLGPHVRRDNLRLFRRGEVDVLVTCRALDEGIDVPDTRFALISASTSSTRQRIQRLGRVLRPAKGKEGADIFTLYATEPEAERLKKEEERLLGASSVSWKSYGVRA